MVCGELSAAVAGLALEPTKHEPRFGLAARAEHFWAHELDGRVPRQQAVLRAPDFTHPALAEQFDKVIAAELLCLAQPPAQPWKTWEGSVATTAQA